GGVARDIEEVGLILRCGDARHGTCLGETELPVAERRVDERQTRERLGDAQFLAGGAERDAAPPAQPVGAGQGALARPAFLLVEAPEVGEQAMGRGIEHRGGLGNAVGKGSMSSGADGAMAFMRSSNTGISDAPAGPRRAVRWPKRAASLPNSFTPVGAALVRSREHLARVTAMHSCRQRAGCQEKNAA